MTSKVKATDATKTEVKPKKEEEKASKEDKKKAEPKPEEKKKEEPKKKKKDDDSERKTILGRPKNDVSMGIVGMPNIGKSSMFNLLSKLKVPAENYPFCTIDPHEAKVPVPDERFDYLCKHFKPKSEVPAVLTIFDIAGLVKGASENKGLGNAFLSHIYAVDGIYHLVRAFDDTSVEHVEGDVNPIRDLEIISKELILKDLSRVKDQIETLSRVVARQKDKQKSFELSVLQKVEKVLNDEKDIRSSDWDNKEIEVLNSLCLLTAKPVVYLVNISMDNFLSQKNKWIKPIKEWCSKRTPGAPVIPFSVPLEEKLDSMADEERQKFMSEKKIIRMLPRVITSGYSALSLIHFFTCGTDEVRAWTIRNGTLAPQAAGVIHSDFENGFVCAETMCYTDFKQHGSEQACKSAGRYRTEGKAYLVKDGDILFFKHAEGKTKAKPSAKKA
eukprot:TRINITY_DN8850_c0_g1_i1.p1 TRINITY_DN8850_c0_g1~~TRINITY_DN8850_c0_g1_i1.p1  ORF type:complete len:443 (-),score=109.87 TRINITY_DN8850_c0_g1_i1:199-1527(-)